MELQETIHRPGCLIMQLNKVHSVGTIDRVAAELGEFVDLLHELAINMETEDGVIWVYGLDDEAVLAFSTVGIERLCELIKMHREDGT